MYARVYLFMCFETDHVIRVNDTIEHITCMCWSSAAGSAEQLTGRHMELTKHVLKKHILYAYWTPTLRRLVELQSQLNKSNSYTDLP